jgi:hypothetical protein
MITLCRIHLSACLRVSYHSAAVRDGTQLARISRQIQLRSLFFLSQFIEINSKQNAHHQK